jgi:hypothetical protein
MWDPFLLLTEEPLLIHGEGVFAAKGGEACGGFKPTRVIQQYWQRPYSLLHEGSDDW